MRWFATCCVMLGLVVAGSARAAPTREPTGSGDLAITVAKRLVKLVQRRSGDARPASSQLAPASVVARYLAPPPPRPIIAVPTSPPPSAWRCAPAARHARAPPVG